MTNQSVGPGPGQLQAKDIESFWQELVYQERHLALLPNQAFVVQANEMLARIAPDLALELERSEGSLFSRLVFSAHGNVDQFENLMALVRAAPSLPGYKVQAFRNRSPINDFSMAMEGLELSCSDVLVAHYDAGGIVGLELGFEKIIAPEQRELAQHMAFIMLDHVLGEWDFAVRVGPVDVVDAFAPEVAGVGPLSAFPAVFDAFLRDSLGRSYRFPPADDDRWKMLEARRRDAPADAVPDLLGLRLSANAVATRADLPYCLQWTLTFEDGETLDQARDAQEGLQAALERMENGILAYTRIEGMRERTACYYVDDAAAARQSLQQQAVALPGRVDVSFDPSWVAYLAVYAAAGAAAADAEHDDPEAA
ncbi:hypothetical protein [Comamonas sp.]|uniref:hypothetical protein n=1 Tax=Comamonas sp. TaxID=34028 RepID=UPI0028A09537|nr:hypothetical protein [Comamonas sp.]